MSWSSFFLALLASLIVYTSYHIFFFLNYIDVILLLLLLYLDISKGSFFEFMIPLSLVNDYFLGLYFGTSALMFLLTYFLRLMVSTNMYFKSDLLKFFYYLTTFLLYNIAISFILNVSVYAMIILVPLRVFLDISLLYLLNLILESRFAVENSK